MNVDAEIESLRAIWPQVSVVLEGGVTWVLLPKTRLTVPGGVAIMDTVLCPNGQGGYSTRLLLESPVTGKPGLNWAQLLALGRTWHTWSWQSVPANQSWLQIYIEHARQLR
jgi:hypothetical protein